MLFPFTFNGDLQFLVRLWIEITEGQIFEFTPNLAHSQAVRQRGVDIHRFSGNRLPTFGGEELKRSHIVKPVCKLDHDYADVVRHREEHLAEILASSLLSRRIELADLRHSVDDMSYFGAKHPRNVI